VRGKPATVTGRHTDTFLTKILVLWPWEPNQRAIILAEVFFKLGYHPSL